MPDKAYLGDGVYVERNPASGDLALTTENGIETTNTIYLEPEVWGALISYLWKHYAENLKSLIEELENRR